MDALARIHQAVQDIERELSPEAETLVAQYMSQIRQALLHEWTRHMHAPDD